ncbi:MAG: glycerate kinase [Runella slithyformis]|nr:MAG: glycerate kinase [Cytophagales bacterium]TAG57495.1 MAG: glycerate kinase [Runella slithyformis]TAG76417.1 MAG: glycerate kinase [Cytophagales bacterium]
MKILLAPDKFRGSLSAIEVCNAMTEGIRLAQPNAEIVALPMADGGEGTAELLTMATNGQMRQVPVQDPLGRPINATYGLSADGKTAFVEMAAASGLSLLTQAERNPLLTTTFGTGQLIADARQQGATHIVLAIGGSATTDAGMGVAAALGWQFFDKNQQVLTPVGQNLGKIERIEKPHWPTKFKTTVACDVNNPLFGPNGAAYVYAPQKGATPEMVQQLDAGLQHFSAIIKRDFGVEIADTSGAGAAGGLGAGALFFLNATLQSGVTMVLEQTQFTAQLAGVDLVLTGEGKIDTQTLQGKLVAGVAAVAAAQNVPVVALCGTLLVNPATLRRAGIAYAASILSRPAPLEEAITHAYEDVKNATFSVINLWQTAQISPATEWET